MDFGGVARRGDRRAQRIDPAPAHRDRGDHRHTQLGGKRGGIEHQPVAFGQVDHVERDHARTPQRDHFLRQHQMLFKVRRIEHQHQHFGLGLAGLLPQDHPRGHRFVGAGRIKAVGAGQVDQFGRFSGRKRHPPRLALDRNTRIVRNFLPRPGQRVEQRAFAGVGIADQRDHGGAPGHATDSDSSSTANARAWTRRSATVIRPTSTAIGSRLRNTPR